MLTTRLLCRPARYSKSRGGFTLVELLVVIGIIAILAGVALGPITNGLKKAKQSGGVQVAHGLYLADYSYANDNNGLFADGSSGTNSQQITQALVAGGYVTDTKPFWISGGKATQPATPIATVKTSGVPQANISWDFIGSGGTGVSNTTAPYLPLLWSSLNATGGTEPANLSSTAVAIPATPSSSNAFGTDGMVVAYINGSSKFIVSGSGGAAAGVCNMVGANDNAGSTLSYTVNLGGG